MTDQELRLLFRTQEEVKLLFRTHGVHGKKIKKALRQFFVNGLKQYQACKVTKCDRSQMSRTVRKIKKQLKEISKE